MTESPAFCDDVAALFPGQGSITGGAGESWRASTHWSIVDRVSEVTDQDVAALLLNATDDEVVRTDRAQLATFALSLVGYHELIDRGIRPRYLLGHSLGEFSALVASGLLALDDGARLIGARGRAMRRATEERDGSMVALMGGGLEDRAALENLTDVWVANINGTGQIVVSGTREGLDDLLARHRELGWRRATPLSVGGAFHSPLMASAQHDFDAALAVTAWGSTDAVVIANVDGDTHADDEWPELLRRQLTSPVEFLAATQRLPEGVTTTIELPPSGVLTGLTKRIRDFDRQFAPLTLTEIQEIVL